MSRQPRVVVRNLVFVTVLLVAVCGLTCYADDTSIESSPPPKEAASKPTPQATADADPNGAVEAKTEALRRELQRVLVQLGVSTAGQHELDAKRLAELADQSEKLAKDLNRPDRQLEAQNLVMRARYVQAQQAQRFNREAEASVRIAQLRSGAWQTMANSATNARPVGDFWLLQADLFDINRAALDRNQRQISTITRIERFLSQRDRANKDRPSDGEEQAMLLEVRLALLRLYDERGLSNKVKALVGQIKKSPHADSAVRAALDRWFGYVDQVGKPIGDELLTVMRQYRIGVQQHPLRTQEKYPDQPNAGNGGEVTIILFQTADMLEKMVPGQTRPHWLNVVLHRRPVVDGMIIAIGDTVGDWIKQSIGPVYMETLKDRKFSRRFAVRTVPRYVLIDHTGKVAAVGGVMIGDEVDRLITASRKDAEKQANRVDKVKADDPDPSNAPSHDSAYPRPVLQESIQSLK